MNTIEQWLSSIPEPARALALKNMWWEDKDNIYPTLQKALRNAFNWSRSPEGYKYWAFISDNQDCPMSPEQFKNYEKENI